MDSNTNATIGSHLYRNHGNMHTAKNFMTAIEKGKIGFDTAAAPAAAPTTGAGVQYYRNPKELTTRLASLLGIYVAGNRGVAIRNELRMLADRLHEDKAISNTQHAKFYRM